MRNKISSGGCCVLERVHWRQRMPFPVLRKHTQCTAMGENLFHLNYSYRRWRGDKRHTKNIIYQDREFEGINWLKLWKEAGLFEVSLQSQSSKDSIHPLQTCWLCINTQERIHMNEKTACVCVVTSVLCVLRPEHSKRSALCSVTHTLARWSI